MSRIAVIGIVGNSVFLPVERFHIGGETVEARDIHFELGGKGFNQAVAAARYGAEVSFLAAVGEDGYDAISKFLSKEKISASLVKKTEKTAFAAIITDTSGSNRVTVFQGAQLSPADVDCFEEEIRLADILLINNEVSEAVNERASDLAQKHGTRIILNPAPARKNSASFNDKIYLFTPNEHETKWIENKSNMIVTLGGEGCKICDSGLIVPAVRVGKVLDTTGAGDTFNGVLASAIADGCSLPGAAKVANIAAGIGVTRRGAVSSIPTKNEINLYEVEKCKSN